MKNNGDTKREITIGGEKVVGIGSFHKTLPHNPYGEVIEADFKEFVKATEGDEEFGEVAAGDFDSSLASRTAALVNPQAGSAKDRLTQKPSKYKMPPAPPVASATTAAEMTELYWMALLRDVSFDKFADDPMVAQAANEINLKFNEVKGNPGDNSLLQTGIDVPGKAGTLKPITPQNLFRLGLPGEDVGPFVSQFFVRPINYGVQTIDQQLNPYKSGMNYLTEFEDWLCAQNSGNGTDGNAYNQSNEALPAYYEYKNDQESEGIIRRYISTPRDLARFVNKDALHQAYFNAALLMMSGGAKWTRGNPYGTGKPLDKRETAFGTLGGPHILALVSEIATRALKVIWHQKWQTHLRLRPEAYGGLIHVQNIGVGGVKRPYDLPAWVANTDAAEAVKKLNKSNNDNGNDSLLLPMAVTAGSPAHPSYGAGHAAVAGACVTVLKAFFKTFDDNGDPVPLVCLKDPKLMDMKEDGCLRERSTPYLPPVKFETYITGVNADRTGHRTDYPSNELTLEGELNKLAMNVAMGRSIAGVHWRTDNARSLGLGEAIAAQVLADITKDLAEDPKFEFRTFSRKANGKPKMIAIEKGKIRVDNVQIGSNPDIL